MNGFRWVPSAEATLCPDASPASSHNSNLHAPLVCLTTQSTSSSYACYLLSVHPQPAEHRRAARVAVCDALRARPTEPVSAVHRRVHRPLHADRALLRLCDDLGHLRSERKKRGRRGRVVDFRNSGGSQFPCISDE